MSTKIDLGAVSSKYKIFDLSFFKVIQRNTHIYLGKLESGLFHHIILSTVYMLWFDSPNKHSIEGSDFINSHAWQVEDLGNLVHG